MLSTLAQLYVSCQFVHWVFRAVRPLVLSLPVSSFLHFFFCFYLLCLLALWVLDGLGLRKGSERGVGGCEGCGRFRQIVGRLSTPRHSTCLDWLGAAASFHSAALVLSGRDKWQPALMVRPFYIRHSCHFKLTAHVGQEVIPEQAWHLRGSRI